MTTTASVKGPRSALTSFLKGIQPQSRPSTVVQHKLTRGKKRKTIQSDFSLISQDWKPDTVPSLQDICIKHVSEHIQCVNTLSFFSRRKISRILSKKRKLEAGMLPIFAPSSELELFDTTNFDTDTFDLIPGLFPSLEHLRLEFCGRLENVDWNLDLTHVHLHGPFLVPDESWAKLFQCKNLNVLHLDYCTKLSNAIFELKNIRELTLDHADGITNDGFRHIGSLPLNKLVIKNSPLSGETFLYFTEVLNLEVLQTNCSLSDEHLVSLHKQNLLELELSEMQITISGLKKFLETRRPLNSLNFDKCPNLNSDDFVKMLISCAPGVKNLSLNRFDKVDASLLLQFENLETLDASWMHSLSRDILEKLQNVQTYGCRMLLE